MGTVEFSTALLKQAEDLLGLPDNFKAMNDVREIERVISAYTQTGICNSYQIDALDERLRKEYPAIWALENFSASLPHIPPPLTRQQPISRTDPRVEALKWDKNGILFTVLIKNTPSVQVSDLIVKAIL